jgi:hypothetical protein
VDVKLIEIPDRATFVPAMAMRVTGTGDWLLRRAGYSLDGAPIILMRLTDCDGHYDPYHWASRTMQAAHVWLLEHFEEVATSDVVDVSSSSARPRRRRCPNATPRGCRRPSASTPRAA